MSLARAPRVVDFDAVFPMSAKQRLFVYGSRRRYQMFLGGRNAGKTHALILKALFLALANPGVAGAVVGRKLSKDVGPKLFKLFMKLLGIYRRETGIRLLKGHNKGAWVTTLTNGAEIHWLAFDRVDQLESLRGYNFAWAVIDEVERASVDPVYAWETLDDAVRDPDAQMMQVATATTPNGLRGVVAKFLKAQENKDRDHYVVTASSYDNEYVDQDEIKKRERSKSSRMAAQEIWAKVLRPSHIIFAEYRKSKHVVPYVVERGHLWGVGVDWGTSKGHIVAAQMSPAGRWTVFDERRADNVSRTGFREILDEFLKLWTGRIGQPPWIIGTDRAVKEENRWLLGRWGRAVKAGIHSCRSTEEQDVLRGIGYVQYMLDPAGEEPRLYFADTLETSLDTTRRGLLGALLNYRYKQITVDGAKQVTNSPDKDQINDDQVDSLRYLVVVSRRVRELHGGDVLPCTRPDEVKLAA